MDDKQAEARLDLYADALHDIAVILREKGVTPSQKTKSLKGIETVIANLYARLSTDTALKEAV